LARAKTPPRLAERGAARSEEPIDLIWGLPSPSSTSIANAATREALCLGTVGCERIAGSGRGVGGETEIHSLPTQLKR